MTREREVAIRLGAVPTVDEIVEAQDAADAEYINGTDSFEEYVRLRDRRDQLYAIRAARDRRLHLKLRNWDRRNPR